MRQKNIDKVRNTMKEKLQHKEIQFKRLINNIFIDEKESFEMVMPSAHLVMK